MTGALITGIVGSVVTTVTIVWWADRPFGDFPESKRDYDNIIINNPDDIQCKRLVNNPTHQN
jgi:hypothetical protein